MRPYHTLLFLIIIGLCIFAAGEIFPHGFKIGSLEIRFYRPLEAFRNSPKEENSTIDKDKLIQLQEKTNQILESDTSIFSGDGSLSLTDTADLPMPEVAFHIDSSSGIQYPSGDSTILYSFFNALDSARNGSSPLRILHFGDSQIEGDRISGYLRQRFQQQYGGCGPGLLPFSEDIDSRTYLRIQTESEPDKYMLYGKPKLGPHYKYSLLHSYFRLKRDTSEHDNWIQQKVQYSLNGQGYRRNNYFERATFLCRNEKSNLSLSLGNTDNQKVNKQFNASDSLRLVTWKMDAPVRRFGIRIQTGAETDFYGLCLDCKAGVAVDNIPLRGSSGLELLRINPRFLQEQIRRLNVKMVILQFGINVVPYESASYTWYENSLVKAIQTLKKSAPGLQVLVIGVSDMARKKDGNWNSFETIPMVLDAQKRACQRTNSAFWDLFQVMGGKNSILAWAKTNPPLAGKDFIHLTPKGAQVIGEFLFQAIMKEKRTDSYSHRATQNLVN